MKIVRLQSAHLPGYNAALSSSLREGPIRGQSSAIQSKAFEDKRVLILHVSPSSTPSHSELKPFAQGTNDFTVPLRYAHKIGSLITEKAQKKW
jgi:hypothetical protein